MEDSKNVARVVIDAAETRDGLLGVVQIIDHLDRALAGIAAGIRPNRNEITNMRRALAKTRENLAATAALLGPQGDERPRG